MTGKKFLRTDSRPLRTGLNLGLAAGLMAALPLQAALTPAQIKEFRNNTGNRIEAATILGGDYGVGGGAYSSGNGGNNVDLNVSKFGGYGDVGSPQPLGNLDIGWQPRLQGSMGYLTAKKTYKSSSILNGDKNENDTFAIQFGGGARFWFSIPTVGRAASA
jgi:hypothetical protein